MDKELIRVFDTLNGALNKQLIDNYSVTRRIDGSKLSDREIMQLTRPYFKMAEISGDPENLDVELHYEESPVMKQFGATIDIAAELSVEKEAARCFVKNIFPMCKALSESPDGYSTSLYNYEQMITAFVAGQQWLRERLAQVIPLNDMTLEKGLALLKDFLFALPKNMSIKQAIDHLKQVDL